jgi:hypothetical protein
MSNCKAGLGMAHFLVKLNEKQNIIASLTSMLDADNDLVENADYFRDDTLELGYKSEADRIVKEVIAELGYPEDAESFLEVACQVFSSISEQEYFGSCDLSVISINKYTLSFAYAYGGAYDN